MIATQTTTALAPRFNPLRWISVFFTEPLTASCQHCGALKLKSAMVSGPDYGYFCTVEEQQLDWQNRQWQ